MLDVYIRWNINTYIVNNTALLTHNNMYDMVLKRKQLLYKVYTTPAA